MSAFCCVLCLIALNPSQSIYQIWIAIGIWFINFISQIKLKTLYTQVLIRNFGTLLFNWNIIDTARLILCVIWIYLAFSNIESKEISFALVALTALRGLTGFRCFDRTRFYVQLVLSSISDIASFIIIFFYCT